MDRLCEKLNNKCPELKRETCDGCKLMEIWLKYKSASLDLEELERKCENCHHYTQSAIHSLQGYCELRKHKHGCSTCDVDERYGWSKACSEFIQKGEEDD